MMASFQPNDPLLLAGKIITILMQGLMALGAVALIVALPVFLIFQGAISAEIAKEAGTADFVLPALPIVGLLILAFAAVVMTFLFFDRLRRIISTVGEGDPFAPINADRLAKMAWLALAVQVIMVPLAGLILYVVKAFDEVENADVTIDAGFDLTGILMVLVLFILARVFRHGAAMREDLEGTV